MGARNLDGYIGDDKSKGDWLKKRMDKWEGDISAVAETAEKHPQESYATLTYEIQS